jgi:hypothetical protein
MCSIEAVADVQLCEGQPGQVAASLESTDRFLVETKPPRNHPWVNAHVTPYPSRRG